MLFKRVDVLVKGLKTHKWIVNSVTTFEDMQELVGGYANRLTLPNNIDLWLNGKNSHGAMHDELGMNLLLIWDKESKYYQPIYGPVFLAGKNNDGEVDELTGSQRYWIAQHLKIAHLNNGQILTAIDLSN